MNYISWGTLIRDMYPLLSISTKLISVTQYSKASHETNYYMSNVQQDELNVLG